MWLSVVQTLVQTAMLPGMLIPRLNVTKQERDVSIVTKYTFQGDYMKRAKIICARGASFPSGVFVEDDYGD